jgi:hypothetical protein
MMLAQPKSRMETPQSIVAADQIPFAQMREAFARAARPGCVHRRYRVAGYVVDLRIVGEQLAVEVSRAFAHLETADTGRPALTIEVWDEAAAGVTGPRDWTGQPENLQVMLKASADGRFVCEHRPQGIALLDRLAHRIVACTSSADRRRLDERARPFHRLLSMWLTDRGIHFVHAGLVSVEGRGILLGGHGGAGKSTSSVACLRAGHRYLGDDHIALERLTDGSFRGYGFYASCLLELNHMHRFAELLPHALRPHYVGEDKAVFYFNELFPGAIHHSTRIDVIALPKVVDCFEARAERASKAETLMALAPNSVMQLTVPTAAGFHTLADLVDSVPSYRLYIGRDIDRIPDALCRMASELVA